jgi:hypothetical protein
MTGADIDARKNSRSEQNAASSDGCVRDQPANEAERGNSGLGMEEYAKRARRRGIRPLFMVFRRGGLLVLPTAAETINFRNRRIRRRRSIMIHV